MAKKQVNGAANEPAEDGGAALVEMAAETLSGDIRDAVLTEFKAMPKPWQQMNEDEQERLIHRAEDIAGRVVRETAKLMAAKGFAHILCQLGKFTVKDGVKLEMTCTSDVETITKLVSHAGTAVLVLAEPGAYRGERAKAEPDVVGDLAMPKGEQSADGERADELALQQVGKGRQPAAAPV